MITMTREQTKFISDKYVKWVPVTVTPVAAILIVWQLATYKVRFENKFDEAQKGALTESEKVRVMNHINQVPNEVDTYIAFKKQDSLMRSYSNDRKNDLEAQRNRDTLIKKNAVTIYQIKEELKKNGQVAKEILDKLNQTNN